MTETAFSGASFEPSFVPPAEWTGRRIAVAAPSHQFLAEDWTISHARRERGLAALRGLGFDIALMGGALAQQGRFAGSDERRAADFEAALEMPGVDLVMPIRGGYGMTRVLPLLDWEAIGRASTPAVGFSDFTAFGLALLAKTGRPSWHGPMLGSFADNPVNGFMLERFRTVFDADYAEREPLVFEIPEADREMLLAGGVFADFEASGLLWGGNLCLIASLLGTEWFPRERIEGGILFLEDVGEAAYRVERMLTTLLDAGVLQSQRAVVLGDFACADDAKRFEGDMEMRLVVEYIRSRLNPSIPIATGLPFGHVARKATLPVGLEGRMTLRNGRVSLSWRGMPSRR